MRKVACLLAALSFLTVTASAVPMYAPNSLVRPYPFSGPDDLIMFDSENPADFVVIGSMAVEDIGFGGMDFDEYGNLWAYAAFYKSTGGAAAGLYSVDINTGLATVQGTLSHQPLEDLAYNPVDHTMYGVRTQVFTTRLYTVDLTTGVTSLVGTFSGLPANQHAMGLAIDSQGNFYIHDLAVDKIYKGAGLEMAELCAIPQDTNYSQGMTIDWSRNDRGYHAAIGYAEFPDFFSQLNSFSPTGPDYTLGPDFGPPEYFPPDPYGYPPVEVGDVAIVPVMPPCPADIDGDHQVALSDLAQLLASYGTTSGAVYADGDLDGDADVDLQDLATLLGAYGTACQ